MMKCSYDAQKQAQSLKAGKVALGGQHPTLEIIWVYISAETEAMERKTYKWEAT